MAEQSQFNYMFTPVKIGPVTVKNRLMTTAHGTGYVDPYPTLGHPGVPGLFNERYARYLADRAKGGCGLVCFGDDKVHPTAAYQVHGVMSCGWPKEAVPLMKMTTSRVHDADGKVFCQLAHGGAHASGVVSRLPVWGASETPGLGSVVSREGPHPMELHEIDELVEYFGICAENAAEAGFDGIELHGGTSYLFHQFHSPLWNKRTDEYGGSLENRMRFTMRVIDKVSSITGDTMALGYRLTVDDFVPGGLDIDDLKEIAQILEATNKLHYFNVATGFHGGAVGMSMYEPHCTIVPYSAVLKEVVDLPVVANMRIVSPVEGEKILADGHADLIAMTRAHIADPEIGNKARDGRLEEIRSCVGCMQGCIGNVVKSLPCDCTQNPSMGREEKWGIGTMQPASVKKRVIVVGGGPAGMEAAWVAAARGHDVTLYEKTDELGGQVILAAKLPGRAESDEWSRYRKVMMEKHGVKVVLGKEITAEEILADNPDSVVVANGSTPYRNGFQGLSGQPIPGWDLPNVMTVDDVLQGKEVTTDKVLIMDEEASAKAPGVAEILASQGKQVEIIDRHNHIGSDLDPMTLPHIFRRLTTTGVKMTAGAFLGAITEDGAVVINLYDQSKRFVEGPLTVILCTGRKPNEDLYFALKGKAKELVRIGDCLAARNISSAIYDGHKVGREM